jgi:Histidine kinase
MHIPASGPCDGVIPGLYEPRIPPASGPSAGQAGDSAEVTLRLVQDRDRIAGDMNDIVVRRLFSAGLALETVLGLMGDQPGTAKVQEAISQLDLAIRDFRNVLFDHHQPADGGPASQNGSVRPRS